MLQSTIGLALQRAGFSTSEDFLAARGIPEHALEMALMPYLVGYELHRVAPGDTYAKIAATYGSTAPAMATANPGKDPDNLQIGALLIVPLDFSLVPEDRALTSELLHYVIRGLEARYPSLISMAMGTTAYGRPISLLRVGDGPRVVYYNASHHANEYITTPLLMGMLEQYLKGAALGQPLMGLDTRVLMAHTALFLTPMVNPDGVDLVLGAATQAQEETARTIAANYPEIPFPAGWKANLRGVDLNLNYPARWEEARAIKFEQGFETPSPRDYVGPAPLSEAETRAMFDATEELSPALTISWHTQGKEVYWRFLDLAPEGAEHLGRQMAAASGYRLSESAYASSFAGYKDWFIQDFDRPGYTIEAGLGENPLPLSQLPELYRDNLPIFLLGLTGSMAPEEEAPIAVTPTGQFPQPAVQKRWG